MSHSIARPKWGAFSYRDFRLLSMGQIVARLGTWMQFTALTYLIGVILSHSEAESSLYLGLLGAMQMVPALVLGLLAGFFADRYPRRPLLAVIALSRALLAVGFALVSTQHGPWVIVACLILAGGFSAADTFDSPIRMSWLTQIVPKHLFSNATGSLTIANNVPYVVGPAIAGIVIATAGVNACFIINAIAQCAVVVAALCMKPSTPAMTSGASMLREIAAGVSFVANHDILRWVVLITAAMSFFGRPYAQLLATFAGLVLHVNAQSYGIMLAAGGIGTLAGGFVIALWRSNKRGWLWFATGLAAGLGVFVLAYARDFTWVLVLLVFIATMFLISVSSLLVVAQHLTPVEMQGRVMSILGMTYFGIIPAGTLVLGMLASFSSLPFAYAFGGIASTVFVAWVWVAYPAMRRT